MFSIRKRPSAVCMLSVCKGMPSITAMKENDRDKCQLSWYLSRFSFQLLYVLVFSIIREWQDVIARTIVLWYNTICVITIRHHYYSASLSSSIIAISRISSTMRLLTGVGRFLISESALDNVVALIGLPVFFDSRCPPLAIAAFQFQPIIPFSNSVSNRMVTLRMFSTVIWYPFLRSSNARISSTVATDTQNRWFALAQSAIRTICFSERW